MYIDNIIPTRLEKVLALFLVLKNYFFPNSQIKKAPPTNPVTIPMGISSGAIKVQAAISAHNKRIAPSIADNGITRI